MKVEPVRVEVFVDGEDAPMLLDIQRHWKDVVRTAYPSAAASVTFAAPRNLKTGGVMRDLEAQLTRVADVRNPDLFFRLAGSNTPLGGIEITVHSPDGSNADKRYPFLWMCRREGLTGFVVCPYSKQRPGGQTNRLPFRHAERNLQLLAAWKPEDLASPLIQILPLDELQAGVPVPDPEVAAAMWSLRDLVALLVHRSALRWPGHRGTAAAHLNQCKADLQRFGDACLAATTRTEPSSLIADGKRWIQVYNTRPDSGHWERGEGQFDSIDGRLMFTLDGIELLPPDKRPESFEFWLPQMTSDHPWIEEQRVRGFASKRLRNILVLLKDEVQTRFADQLLPRDWAILRQNSGLVLERDDWEPGLYCVAALAPPSDVAAIAATGLGKASSDVVAQLAAVLRLPLLYFSAHRAYRPGWDSDFRRALAELPRGATVLVPRIPSSILNAARIETTSSVRIVGAEACGKAQLMALRQLHRSRE